MHDGIAFEKRGVPAASVCTHLFIATGNAAARIQGIPDYRYVVVQHPTGRLPEEELLQRVRGALPEVVGILTGKG